MNEERLPSWVRLSVSGDAGSPRRVAQFDDLHQRYHRHRDEASSALSPRSISSRHRYRSPAPSRLKNPFLSSSLSQEQDNNKTAVEDYLQVQNSMLSIYCRQGLWEQALERCETHPHEAQPVNIVRGQNRSDFFEEAESWTTFLASTTATSSSSSGGGIRDTHGVATPPLYEVTPLGILCSSPSLHDVPADTLVELVGALRRAGDLVSASQKTVGNTPLRQAILNPACPPDVLGALLKKQEQQHHHPLQDDDVLQALQLADEHGVYPLDHLLQRVRRQPQGQQQHNVDELLRTFLRNAPLQAFGHGLIYSPLVRFYSMVRSHQCTSGAAAAAGLHESWRHQQLHVPTLWRDEGPARRMDSAVVHVTQMLLQAIPGLLAIPSRTTGCMPIHAALRNYGYQSQLIEVLLSVSHNKAQDLQFMLHRNHFGDLPLHVACACGVPLPVLRLVLARTVQAAATPLPRGGRGGGGADALLLADPVLWSTNHAGYTPIDLEWIRHIEAGNGFSSHSVFQPIGVEGIPRPRGRYDDLYDKLLRQAVDQVMKTAAKRSSINHTSHRQMATTSSQNDSDDVFGLLLHRIFLIIRATFHDSFSQSPFDLSGDILHQASALFQPRGPSIPEAIMDLLLWQYPEQVQQLDHLGRTPLHHAVHVFALPSQVVVSPSRKSVAWERWIQELLEKSSPNVTRIADGRGRFPLHDALDCRNGIGTPCPRVHNVIVQLVEQSPEILQVRDPMTRLYPALQAASHSLLPLETVYWLLRREPGILT